MGHHRPKRHEAPARRERALAFKSPLSTTLHVCCAPDAAQLARCLASSPPPPPAPPTPPRAFAPGPSAPPGSAPGSALTWPRRQQRAQQVVARGSRLSIAASPARAARCAEAVDAVRPRRGAGLGWPRLPHRLRVRRAGTGQESGSRGAEQAGRRPGCWRRGGDHGQPREGAQRFRGSAPRAATEHAQSPSRAGGRGSRGREAPRRSRVEAGVGGRGRVKSAARAAVGREGGGRGGAQVICSGVDPGGEARGTGVGEPQTCQWDSRRVLKWRARCIPRSLPRDL